MQQFKGRVVVPGTCTAEALVSHGGFNTLASYQMAMMFGDKQVKCGDQNNPSPFLPNPPPGVPTTPVFSNR